MGLIWREVRRVLNIQLNMDYFLEYKYLMFAFSCHFNHLILEQVISNLLSFFFPHRPRKFTLLEFDKIWPPALFPISIVIRNCKNWKLDINLVQHRAFGKRTMFRFWKSNTYFLDSHFEYEWYSLVGVCINKLNIKLVFLYFRFHNNLLINLFMGLKEKNTKKFYFYFFFEG